MLNKEEFEILNSYPLYQFVSIRDYVTDFAIKNPQNHPITSTLVSHLTYANGSVDGTLKDVYNRDTIHRIYPSFKRTMASLYRLENCKNFTSALIMLDAKHHDGEDHSFSFAILKKIEDKDFIVICKSDNSNYYYIFDTDYTMGMICIDNNDYSLLMNECIHHEIDYDNLPCDSYKFFTKLNGDQRTQEDYFRRYEMIMRYITGKAVMTIEKQSNFTSLQLGLESHTLIYYMQNNHSRYSRNTDIDQFFVAAKKMETCSVSHPQSIDSNPLFDKKIPGRYTN